MHNEVRVFNPNFHLDISLVFDYFSDALGPFVYIGIEKIDFIYHVNLNYIC